MIEQTILSKLSFHLNPIENSQSNVIVNFNSNTSSYDVNIQMNGTNYYIGSINLIGSYGYYDNTQSVLSIEAQNILLTHLTHIVSRAKLFSDISIRESEIKNYLESELIS